jgi:hypothetical protein
MTPISCYGDLCQFRGVYLVLARNDLLHRLPPEISSGLDEILGIGEKIAGRTPDRFARRSDVVFMTMALSILASIAAGEAVELSSVEGCIRAYTDTTDNKPMGLSEMRETQFCRVGSGPCIHCVDRFRDCRHFYEVS